MSELRMTANEAETARWFAALRRGVMSLDERNAYEAWRREPQNARAMAEMEQAWTKLAALQDHFAHAPAETAVVPQRPKLARSALLAAMCAVTLGIGILSYSGHNGFWTTLDWTDR